MQRMTGITHLKEACQNQQQIIMPTLHDESHYSEYFQELQMELTLLPEQRSIFTKCVAVDYELNGTKLNLQHNRTDLLQIC